MQIRVELTPFEEFFIFRIVSFTLLGPFGDAFGGNAFLALVDRTVEIRVGLDLFLSHKTIDGMQLEALGIIVVGTLFHGGKTGFVGLVAVEMDIVAGCHAPHTAVQCRIGRTTAQKESG